MIQQLKDAVSAAIILGVKWAIVILIIGVALLLLAGDYQVVRQRAFNGQQAFEFIQRMNQQQVSQPAVPAVAEPPAPTTTPTPAEK